LDRPGYQIFGEEEEEGRMSLQLISLALLGLGAYVALQASQESNVRYMSSMMKPAISPSAFVGYDEASNTWPDPLMVTFNRPHLPTLKVENGPYGVPRIIYSSQYGESQIPLFGRNIEKI
jgi:hypothetical protein